MKQYIRYFAIFYLALTMAATASADTGFSDHGTFEVDGLTFVPSIRGLPWCRPDTTFAYKGARELVDEGSVSKLFPMFEVFGKALRKACPEARSIAYTTISTFGMPSFCCFSVRAKDFVPVRFSEARPLLPDEPVYECDRLAAHPNDITAPKGVTAMLEPEMDAASAVAACEADVADHPDIPRLHFQLGRALLMNGQHDAAFKEFRKAERAGHALGILYLGHSYANGWGVKKDLGPANQLWRVGGRLGGHTPDARKLEVAVARATGGKARYICPRDVDDRECAEREYWAQFRSSLSSDERRRIERMFTDVSPGFRELFVSFYGADFAGLEQIKRQRIVAATGRDTAVGLVAGLFRGLKTRINDEARKARWEPVVAQYALIKSNAVGLCGERGRQFAVDQKLVRTWRNGFGVVVDRTTQDRGRTYFSVPAKFADVVKRAETTGEAATYASGIRRMIQRNGGCGSKVLKRLEANMLAYQSWKPKRN
uniref:hypothetical protein n=1 Tax=Stappia sp. TaxID=1870903 RepID=UPI003BA9FD07